MLQFLTLLAALGGVTMIFLLVAEVRRLRESVDRLAKAAEQAARKMEAPAPAAAPVQASAPAVAAPVAPPPVPAAAQPSTAPAAAASAPAAAQDDEPSPVILAVITAAIAAMLRDRPFRIRRVRYAPVPVSSSWVDHGRSMIHASHRPGRK